jgi:hypothetical protein
LRACTDVTTSTAASVVASASRQISANGTPAPDPI